MVRTSSVGAGWLKKALDGILAKTRKDKKELIKLSGSLNDFPDIFTRRIFGGRPWKITVQ
jgi:hypothetical protein